MAGRFDTLLVEIEFTASTWTDVTDYVNLESGTLEWGRGRGNAFEVASTGSASFLLDNVDGRFTPGSAVLSTGAANPYYPHVVENLRVRIRVDHLTRTLWGDWLEWGTPSDWDEPTASVTYDLWLGYIDSWAAAYPGGESKWSRVQVTASDRFKLLARRQLGTVYEEALRFAGADAYYPLSVSNEEATGLSVTDRIRQDGAGLIVAPAFNPLGTQTWDNSSKPQQLDGALVFAGTVSGARGYGAGVATIPALSLTGDYTLTVGFWFKTTDNSAYLFSADNGMAIRVNSNDLSFVHMGTANSLGTSTVIDDEWHHAMCVFTLTAGSYDLVGYLDGAVETAFTPVGVDDYGPFSPWILNGDPRSDGLYLSPSKQEASYNVSYSGLFMADADLSAFVVDIYNAGRNNIEGDTSAARAARILGWAGLAASEYEIASDTSAIIGAQDGNKSALDALQEVAQAEYAPAYVQGEGLVKFQSRAERATFTPAVTFNADTDLDGNALNLILADEGVVNTVVGQITGGASVSVYLSDVFLDTYVDSYANTVLSPVSDTVDAPWSTLDQAKDAAFHRLAEKYQARLRMSPVVITPLTASADIWASCFALDVSTLMRITGLNPATMGGRTQKDFYVEGYRWAVSLHDVTLTVDTEAQDSAFGQIEFDDDNTGRFGHDSGTMAVGTVGVLSGVGTGTFTVTTSSGPLWTVTAGDFPLTLKIEEEEMTVSGITGGTSPQTVTVSARGANGTTAAAHATTTLVELWSPPVYAH